MPPEGLIKRKSQKNYNSSAVG